MSLDSRMQTVLPLQTYAVLFNCSHTANAKLYATDSSAVVDAVAAATVLKHETPALKSARKLAEVDTRIVASGTFVGRGLNPSLLQRTVGDSALMDVVDLLHVAGQPFGKETMTAEDVVACDEKLLDAIAEELVGTVGAIGSDSAGLRNDKAVAIVYTTHKGTYLLTLVWPNDAEFPPGYEPVKDDWTYNVPKAAADIRAACVRVGLDIEHQVQKMRTLAAVCLLFTVFSMLRLCRCCCSIK
jgi:hypothetical protein